MSALLFNLVIDWVMCCSMEDQPRGIRWTLFLTLEDLDFTDEIALLSITHCHMQGKTSIISTYACQVGPNINLTKTKVLLALNQSR